MKGQTRLQRECKRMKECLETILEYNIIKNSSTKISYEEYARCVTLTAQLGLGLKDTTNE